MHPQILLIEDDHAIREGVCDALQSAGMAVVGVDSGEAGLDAFCNGSFDLLLLDVILPGRDGISVLQEVRQLRPGFPVIMLTAKGAVTDRVRGLKLGADDYVVKPFSVPELLARIDAVLRRSPSRDDPAGASEVDETSSLDLDTLTLSSKSKSAELSEKEAQLLRYFVTHVGRMISRDELIQQVWSLDPRGLRTRTVDMHVARLREKLASVSDSARIRTLRGRGYLFERETAADRGVT